MKKDESQHTTAERFISVVQKHFRSLIRRHNIALGIIFCATLLLGLIIAGLLEWTFYLPSALKISLLLLFLLGAGSALFYFYKKLQLPSFKEFYHQFGKTTNNTKLGDALDLHLDSKSRKPALHEAAIRQNLQHLSQRDVQSELKNYVKNHTIHKHYSSGIAGATFALILLASFTWLQPSAMERLSHFWINYSPPNPYSYTIEPGSLTLEQGESFIPKIVFDEEVPEQLSLAFKTDIEEEYRQRNAVERGSIETSFAPLSFSTNGSYYFIMDGYQSETYHVDVQLRPRLEQLSLQVIPPDYTRLDTTSYTYPFSQIRAYPGSTIQWKGITNKPVTTFSLLRSATSDSISLASSTTDTTAFAYQWTVETADTVWFQMADSAGLSNKNKFRFVIQTRDDQFPFVNLVSPSDNIQMKTPKAIDVEYEAGDDFGLTAAALHYELQRAFTDAPEKGSISLSSPLMNELQSYEWDLPSLNLKPRDVLTYWIEVSDNDGYRGAKVGRSQKLLVRFPSMTEYMDELEGKETEVTEDLDKVSDSFEQMQQEYDEFKKQLQQNPETNWEQKKQLQQVEEKRKEIDKQVQELNKKFEDIRKEIEKNQSLSPETMKAYDELQKLMDDIDSPELRKALEELQKSMGEMNPDQMRKALEDYEFNEELYKQRIERTKELFKSLKLNSDLEKMAQSLEELSRQEQEVSESEQTPTEDLEQQKAIQNDLKNVQKKLDKLDKSAPQKSGEQVKELQQQSQQQMEDINNELQQNMEQLKKQESQQQTNPDAKQQQQRIQQKMQKMAEQMRSAKQQLNQQRQQINMGALQYVLYSLINLSTNQEELTKETENLPTRSQAFVDKARNQKNISSQFTSLSDSLFSISSEIPSFSNQINKKKAEVESQISRSVEMLAERDKSNATYAQRQSLGGINELSSMIASLLDQLQNSQQGGGGGSMSMQQMMEQMQKMSGQQQKLNQQIQNMINDMQGNRLSQDQMERLNQLSKQQNQIRKQLNQLQRNGGLESGDRVLSELQRMSEEMENAINDLRGGQLDRQLMQRQQNILSRMLSAEKAVQERGEKEEREGTTAEDEPRSVPPDVTLEELQQRIRKMLNDPDHTKFSEDYQRLIEQYFELLKQQDKNTGDGVRP